MPRERFKVEQLRGECVVCGQVITEADYDRQAVVAAIGPEGVVVCCVSHLNDQPTNGPNYRQAVQRMAEAKAEQLRAAAK